MLPSKYLFIFISAAVWRHYKHKVSDTSSIVPCITHAWEYSIRLYSCNLWFSSQRKYLTRGFDQEPGVPEHMQIAELLPGQPANKPGRLQWRPVAGRCQAKLTRGEMAHFLWMFLSPEWMTINDELIWIIKLLFATFFTQESSGWSQAKGRRYGQSCCPLSGPAESAQRKIKVDTHLSLLAVPHGPIL